MKCDGLSPDLVTLVHGLTESLKELAILVHWFTGLVDEEAMTIQNRRTCTPAEFVDAVRVLEPDELLQLRLAVPELRSHARKR